jgi:hypothetical protein
MILSGLAGFALIALFLLMGLYLAHAREQPVYRRPALFLHPRFWMTWTLLRGALFIAGWALAWRAFPWEAAEAALVLSVAWGWRRYLQGRGYRRRMVRRAFESEKARDPAASEVQVLRRVLHAMHPRWGEELIEQIAADNPTPEAVADMVVRMERGGLGAGFDPARLLRRQ